MIRAQEKKGWFWSIAPLFFCLIWAGGAFARSATQVLVVAPQEFVPASVGVRYTLTSAGLGPLCMTQGAGYFLARVAVPVAARIEGIEAVFDDVSDDAFGVVALFRTAETARELLALTPMSLARPLREVSAVQLPQPEVVREGFQYWLHLTLTGPGVCLRAVRVLYEAG
ncbi:MAG: hypothetical protein N3C12_15640 [Candidatus Binatia bacterium]|nr:hypothetical protein [Candidatus Binatia bacterium]